MPYYIILANRLDWNFPLLVVSLLLLCFYYFFIYYRKSSGKHSLLFIIGMCLFYLLAGSPIAEISHISFTTHMFQISMLYFIIPPLLLFGIPKDLFRFLFMKKIKLDPIIIMIIFAFFLYIYHTPAFLEFVTTQKSYHTLFTWFLFILSIFMWIPLISSKINQNVCFEKSLMKLNVWFITPACLLFLFLPFQSVNPMLLQMLNLCFPPTETTKLIQPLINIQLDQQLAGIIMFFMHKVGLAMTTILDQVIHNRERSFGYSCSVDFFFIQKLQ
ncbi:cytochrome c oxidase assembly protein [Heyndrickxia sp. NPDC080065]|uniref:cytochrome c oxidase assembly protein n=1 Tax=Heyndrickxia sp. NPDC080065 TaxID=3390568 RepID=UPI003D089C65